MRMNRGVDTSARKARRQVRLPLHSRARHLRVETELPCFRDPGGPVSERCTNCEASYEGEYCPACGQRAEWPLSSRHRAS